MRSSKKHHGAQTALLCLRQFVSGGDLKPPTFLRSLQLCGSQDVSLPAMLLRSTWRLDICEAARGRFFVRLKAHLVREV